MRSFAIWNIGAGFTFANGWHVSMCTCGEIERKDNIRSSDQIEVCVYDSEITPLFGEDHLVMTIDQLPGLLHHVSCLSKHVPEDPNPLCEALRQYAKAPVRAGCEACASERASGNVVLLAGHTCGLKQSG